MDRQDEANEAMEWQRDQAFNALLDAAEATMSLWIRHGLGDNEDESGPVYLKLERAILQARKF